MVHCYLHLYLVFTELCFPIYLLQNVDMQTSYLCGYLKIKGLTEEYPTLTTFFDGEIISEKHPFLTRKWDADEEVDRKHWVIISLEILPSKVFFVFCSHELKAHG